MKTILDIHLVTFVPEGFHVVTKMLNVTQDMRDPDMIVDEYLKFLFQDNELIVEKDSFILHSTSWRYEAPKSIFLTYMVYADSFSFEKMNPLFIKQKDLQVGTVHESANHKHEKVSNVRVISHGLRHIAFLVRNDEQGTYEKVLRPATIALFLKLDKELAGRI